MDGYWNKKGTTTGVINCNLGKSKLYLLDNKVHVNATGVFDCRGSQRTVSLDLFAGDSSPGKCTTGRGNKSPDGRRRREKRIETGESEENDLA